jgi:hypothetical protein
LSSPWHRTPTLPLARAGVRMDGIEQSRDMVDRIREKTGGNTVEVTIGDKSWVTTGRSYGLVYLVYNTIGTCSPKTTRSAASSAPPAAWQAKACSSSNAAYRPPPARPGQ